MDAEAYEAVLARCRALADHRQSAELVQLVTPEVVARGWIEFRGGDDSRAWVDELLTAPPEEFRDIQEFRRTVIDILSDTAPPTLLPAVAAELFEDTFDDDTVSIEWIERRCLESAGMREIIRHSWLKRYVSKATYGRLKIAAGGVLSDENTPLPTMRERVAEAWGAARRRFRLIEWVVIPLAAFVVGTSTILFFNSNPLAIGLTVCLGVWATWDGVCGVSNPHGRIRRALLSICGVAPAIVLLVGSL